MNQKLVVIGNGMASGRMLEHLYESPNPGFDVTIFSAEPRVNYDRMMLSAILTGEHNFEDIVIHNDAWYAERGIKLHKGKAVVDIDRIQKSVTALDGTSAHYDKLVIATGSTSVIPPTPGADLDGVVTYRDLDDVDSMLQAALHCQRAVVISGGLLGLEAAAGLAQHGMNVSVLHLCSTLMERQIDNEAGVLLRQALEARDINVYTDANPIAIHGDTRAQSVELEDGRQIDADIVVIAIGIRPNIALARGAGLETKHGIVVDDQLRTSDLNILAIGECVEYKGISYDLVAPLYDMAKVAAAQLQEEPASYSGSSISTKRKLTGIDVHSAGDVTVGEYREEFILRTRHARPYGSLRSKRPV